MERLIGTNIIEVPAKIDYWSLQVPTYESAFSTNPRWRNNENDPYICTAIFTKSYIENINANGGTFSRSKDNMLPAFFVYESDKLPLSEQLYLCKKLQSDPIIRNWIFSQTFSGSKSIHTLVYIDPIYREAVARDFKYYWKVVGERIFGEDKLQTLDTQCASIGRLSRNPNGIRENGIKQKCIFYNSNYMDSPINLGNWITEHTKFLRKLEIEMQVAAKKRQEAYANNTEDEPLKLKRIYKKGQCSDLFKLAYRVLVENDCPKGGDYVGAAAALKGCGFSYKIIEDMLTKASDAHPTNISKKSIGIILRRLNV